MSNLFQKNNNYLQYEQLKNKRITNYTIKISQGQFQKEKQQFKDCLEIIQNYYRNNGFKYEYEIAELDSNSLLKIKTYFFKDKA